MKKIFLTLAVAAFGTVLTANAQEKGVDPQTRQIRRASDGSNPNRDNTGAGRGIDWGKGKTRESRTVPNPYRLASKRDILLNTIQDLLKERKLVMDTAASRLDRGIIVTQPYTFVKGAVVARGELLRYAELPDRDEISYTRGRYTLTIEVQSIDGINNNVSVNAKVEGRQENLTGAQWMTFSSSGVAEQEFLAALVELVTGKNPTEPIEEPADKP